MTLVELGLKSNNFYLRNTETRLYKDMNGSMEDEDFMKDLDQDQFNGDYKYLKYMDAFVECNIKFN